MGREQLMNWEEFVGTLAETSESDPQKCLETIEDAWDNVPESRESIPLQFYAGRASLRLAFAASVNRTSEVPSQTIADFCRKALVYLGGAIQLDDTLETMISNDDRLRNGIDMACCLLELAAPGEVSSLNWPIKLKYFRQVGRLSKLSEQTIEEKDINAIMELSFRVKRVVSSAVILGWAEKKLNVVLCEDIEGNQQAGFVIFAEKEPGAWVIEEARSFG
jgi:hypothetical protein